MGSRDIRISPRSKRDASLPYTYEALVDILAGRGREPILDHYFSDTLCGLIECLAEQEIQPAHVELRGVFKGRQVTLDTGLCADAGGAWLRRPEICRVLEEHYAHTHEECYRGHVEQGTCAFDDRDRSGSGPLW